jgi:hypothetical protein
MAAERTVAGMESVYTSRRCEELKAMKQYPRAKKHPAPVTLGGSRAVPP